MFTGKKTIKIDQQLYRRVVEAAERSGYSSTNELIEHVLQREVAGLEERSDDEQAERQLRGLGYIE